VGGAATAVVMLATFVAATVACTRALGARRPVEAVLLAFLAWSAQVLASGYALSAAAMFHSTGAWAGCGAAWLAVAAAALVARRDRPPALALSPRVLLVDLAGGSRADRLSVGAPLATVAVLGAVNLVTALVVAPFTIDCLTYHLPRVGYYLQHGHLGYFEANYPNQVVHAKGSAVLLAWAFLAADRREAAMALVQYAAYWVALAAVYGVGRQLGAARRYACLGACLFGLLTITLLQASTPQNDLLLAAYVGCALWFVLAWGRDGGRRDVVAAGLAIGMACGVKMTGFVAIPALAVAAGYALAAGSTARGGRRAAALAGSTVLGLALFAAPAGYVDNSLRFGNAFTPAASLAPYTLTGKPLGHVLKEGSKNVPRYLLEFLSLDGLPPIPPVLRLQHLVRLPAKAFAPFGLEEAGEPSLVPFRAHRDPRAREEYAYFGILGMALLWIVPWLAVRGSRAAGAGAGARALALAAIVHVVSVAYSTEYDPWRGRLFLVMAVFALPAIARVLEARRSAAWRAFQVAVAGLACGGALATVVFREHATLVSARWGARSTTSILLQDRAAQLTAHIPRYAEPVRRFDALVPRDATVAIYGDYMFEYVFFGPRMTRRLIPLGDGRAPMRPLPPEADYLVFSNKTLAPLPADAHLGADWYLRGPYGR
jgi:hypothetical protein